MTDYNDGEWHGWPGGGECPVHPMSEVDVLNPNDVFNHDCPVGYFDNAGDVDWALPLLFRVTKPYREPREAWSVGAHLRDTEAEAIAFRAAVAADHGPHHLETPIIHYREVLE